MNVVARRALVSYWTRQPETEQALKAWYKEARRSEWRHAADIKAMYGSASIVGHDRIVFNICGNKHRLIVRVSYVFKTVYIRFIGTHKEYDEVDAATI